MPRPGVGFIAQADDVQQLPGTGNGLFARGLLVGDRRLNQVLQHRQVRKQVKVLKHVADVDPLAEDLLLFHLIQLVAFAAIADIVAINLNKPFINALEVINGAQQRGLARTGRAEDHRHRARRYLQGHIVQRFVAAIVFADAGDRDMAITRAGHGRPPGAVVDVRVDSDGCCGRCSPPSGARCAPGHVPPGTEWRRERW
ncbi:hypothetical protein SB00610_04313 [Klebsiella quasipneumoniae subsp. similipneumoniae]|nr:hypothetical protein SB00610_04313 [Klebsiella quasipneumoniae subsp. similipneumoniae]